MLPDEKKVRKCEGERDGGLRNVRSSSFNDKSADALPIARRPSSFNAFKLPSLPAFQHLSFVL
jgi:hypothetical protein